MLQLMMSQLLPLLTVHCFMGGTKHIEIDYHFVFEKATCKDVQINYVSTVDQIGDLPISSPNHFLTQGFGN